MRHFVRSIGAEDLVQGDHCSALRRAVLKCAERGRELMLGLASRRAVHILLLLP